MTNDNEQSRMSINILKKMKLGKAWVFLFCFFIHIHSLSAQNTDSLSVLEPIELRNDSLVLLQHIDSIVLRAIRAEAFPGCQILVAKDGEVIFEKAYGHHNYDSLHPVRTTDLYDLASVTKILSATLAMMKLYDEGLLDLDKDLAYYFPFLKNSNKADLTIRKVLSHQAGIESWIPFYKEGKKKNGQFRPRSISFDSSRSYPNRIPSSELFLHKNYMKRKLYKMIKKSPLYETESYVYSGLFFYLVPDLVKRLSGMDFDTYLSTHFYESLEASSICFNPLERYELSEIVPTEKDQFFRMSHLHGAVHDEGAAMMLGISGNAGLFANTNDVAKIMQMLQNGGQLNEKTYLSEETVSAFTSRHYEAQGNRRGLGFDKPLIEYHPTKSSVAQGASPASFGHTGYTGTLAWADPKTGIVYVFLSNRVNPSRDNKVIYQLNVRPDIHNIVYEMFFQSDLKE